MLRKRTYRSESGSDERRIRYLKGALRTAKDIHEGTIDRDSATVFRYPRSNSSRPRKKRGAKFGPCNLISTRGTLLCGRGAADAA